MTTIITVVQCSLEHQLFFVFIPKVDLKDDTPLWFVIIAFLSFSVTEAVVVSAIALSIIFCPWAAVILGFLGLLFFIK
jgi:hypothetical protein